MWKKKKEKSFTYQASKFTECRQTVIQRLAPHETELGLAPTVQSDCTVFLSPDCQHSWQMQTVRSRCCHSSQMSARTADPTQPANKLHIKLASLPGHCHMLIGSKTHKKPILWSAPAFLWAEVIFKSYCDEWSMAAMFSPFVLDIFFLFSLSINSLHDVFFFST